MIKNARREKKVFAKIVILGDVNVGKSNIIRRILGEDYQELPATIGVEFGYYDVNYIDIDGYSVSLQLQIWDTSGAERYRAITKSHIRNADGAILVYDITNLSTFNSLDLWYDAIKKATDENIVIYVVGNKLDLINMNENYRKVTREKALNFVMKYNLSLWGECSAKENTNIFEIFSSLYTNVYYSQKEKTEKNSIDLKKNLKLRDPNRNCCL